MLVKLMGGSPIVVVVVELVLLVEVELVLLVEVELVLLVLLVEVELVLLVLVVVVVVVVVVPVADPARPKLRGRTSEERVRVRSPSRLMPVSVTTIFRTLAGSVVGSPIES